MATLQEVARDLGQRAPELKKELAKGLKEAAVVVANEAKLIIGFYSSRIPGSIKIIARNLNVVVRSGSAAAPHAKPFEHGGVPGTFRHPVFGHRDNPWVTQIAHPYLAPALLKEQEKFDEMAIAAIDRVLAAAGFH